MATAAIGIVGAIYQRRQDRKAASREAAANEKLTTMNLEAAEADMAMVRMDTRNQLSMVRRDRALAGGSIRAAAAASGADIDSGSVAAALIANARQGAYEEYITEVEAEHQLEQLQRQAEVTSQAGQTYQAQARAKKQAANVTAWGQIATNAAAGYQSISEGSYL